MHKFFDDKKHLVYIIFSLIIFIISIGLFFGIQAYLEYRAEQQVKNINLILNNGVPNYDNCSLILDFDKTNTLSNEFFNEVKFDGLHKTCDNVFNIKNIELNELNCKEIIRNNKDHFEKTYIILDNFEKQKNICTSKFLITTFTEGELFQVENDFKSQINFNFGTHFYSDLGEVDSDEFIENRIEAKKRFLDMLIIEPAIDLGIEDIVLYPKRGTLNLPLEPLTEYKISLKNFDTNLGEETKNKEFIFTTEDNKYFGMKILDKVSLYQDNKPPRFQLLEYNTQIDNTTVKICRIPNETYAKIEVFRKKAEESDVKDFFLDEIDRLENFDCKEKDLTFGEGKNKDNLEIIKKDFNFDDLIGDVSRSGLYFVTFANKKDREYNGKMNYPIFFGIVDSHVTMKISRNAEAFFFVNDFEGKPLANQNIKLYLNDFKEFERVWNRDKREYDINTFSALNKDIFGEAIYLGLTGKDGILKVNLKEVSKNPNMSDELRSAFSRTFSEDWNYSREGLYRTFFITSASDTNLSYVNSTWNAGIAPWNFGYKVSSGYWESNSQSDQDMVSLDKWGMIEPEYYSHIYTDRLLYLPGETVNIKLVIRKSADLSIPKGQEVELQISDSTGKEILNENIIINDFGSISTHLNLPETSALGSYNISVWMDDKSISFGGFSVEVFKNPKFKNEVSLTAKGLNQGLVKIKKEENIKHTYWNETLYTGDFTIQGTVFSKYYNGASVNNAEFTYKVYKQDYWDNSYWDDCYYGCYWEPNKEFYSEGKGTLDVNGVGNFNIDVDFESSYGDYKYIVEVTVTDKIGDTISGTNSVIAKLPHLYKRYNHNLSLGFQAEEKFIKAGEKVVIDGGLNIGKWTGDYDDKYVFIIKKKEYINSEVDDVRGYKRNVTRIVEKLEKVLLVNDNNFKKTSDGKLELQYTLKDVGEYVFEYGKIQNVEGYDIKDVLQKFNTSKVLEKEIEREREIYICEPQLDTVEMSKECEKIIKNVNENIKLSDLYTDKKYFSILTYGDTNTNIPLVNDNKIRVIPEKISYHLGETAKVLIRLPFSKGKILWTIEKQGVIEHEYIDITSNTFFKEVEVDDKFIPNAYIGVVAIEIDNSKVPEYKVGYSEIVVDKTDKKAFITVKSDKKVYAPRDKVSLNISAKNNKNIANQTELTVMVIDDSLISLLGNIDLNSLEKFYKKLPFQIQTSITNIAMLRNYYFSRPGIVGGSGFGNFKGGDSAVSSRNIFKNTAYYNASVITDKYGNAQVNFDLPDNLTNFRIMVLSNSKDNLFGYSESFIEVRKNVIVEDKTPLILRDGDISVIGANIFNNTQKEIGFTVTLDTNIQVSDKEQMITIPGGTSKDIYWTINVNTSDKEIPYKITALGDSVINSDKIENKIILKESPILITNIIKSGNIDEKGTLQLDIKLPKNIDLDKSEIELSFSNNKLEGIDKIVKSLAKYPYGCIEQTVSSTLPNVILKKFDHLFSGIIADKNIINKNIDAGIKRILSMQTADGGFAYWQGGNDSNLHITPYVVRSLIEMKQGGNVLPEGLLENGITYLQSHMHDTEISDLEKAEIFWALSKAGKNPQIKLESSHPERHTLLAYTYGLVLQNKGQKNTQIDTNIELIKIKLQDSNYYNRYWNTLGDTAIFTSLLIDYNYQRDYIDTMIDELYSHDWESYYYSTQSKNNAFIAFAKYIEKYSKENNSQFGYTLGNYSEKNILKVGGNTNNIYKKTYTLSQVLKDKDHIELEAENIGGNKIYVGYTLKAYPKDKVKITSHSNGIQVKREIFEVIDENDMKEQCTWKNNNYSCTQPQGLQLVQNDIYKKGTLYKVQISVDFEDTKSRRNLTVEDYLPGAFRVINSKFKTEEISVKDGTTTGWNWSHIELQPDVVMANASYVWSGGSTYEYFFKPEFKGTYLQPPVTAYMMYNPDIRAHSDFRVIEVK